MRVLTSPPLVVLFLLVTGCVSLSPERVAQRKQLSAAAAKCAPQYPAVESWEIDSFDRVVAWYKENKSPAELQPFFECVRVRVREEAESAQSRGTVRILREMPATGTIPTGHIVYVDDGGCPLGQVKEVTGGSLTPDIPRRIRCVDRPK